MLRILLWCCFICIKITEKLFHTIKKSTNFVYGYLLKNILVAQVHKFNKVEKLNVGCGYYFLKDWLNIGLFPWRDYPEGLIIRKDNGALVLNTDANKVLSVFSSSIIYICKPFH